jgi:membrane protease YdiL (CAAX protease family)
VPLAALLNKVLCVFLNDILLLFDFPYFTGSDWGPMLYDPRLRLLEQWGKNSFVIALVCMVVFVPVVEELLFRGLILGRIYEKSEFLGVILSTLLFAVFRTLPYLSMAADGHGMYLLVYFLQHVPYCLFLSWLYISTDSIAAPILMQMIYNYFDVLPG